MSVENIYLSKEQYTWLEIIVVAYMIAAKLSDNLEIIEDLDKKWDSVVKLKEDDL